MRSITTITCGKTSETVSPTTTVTPKPYRVADAMKDFCSGDSPPLLVLNSMKWMTLLAMMVKSGTPDNVPSNFSRPASALFLEPPFGVDHTKKSQPANCNLCKKETQNVWQKCSIWFISEFTYIYQWFSSVTFCLDDIRT